MLHRETEVAPFCRDAGEAKARAAIETLCYIQTRGGLHTPLRFNPIQEIYWRERSARDIILKARQVGMTTLLQAEFFMDAMTTPGLEVLYVAQRDDSAKRLFEITTRFLRSIPEEIRPPTLSDSTHKIVFEHSNGHNSAIEIGTAGSRSFGRGRPVHRALFTEVAFYEGNEENTLAGIVSAMPGPDSEIPGRYVLESTANGQSGFFYEMWQAASSGTYNGEEAYMSGLKPHFFPWWLDPTYRIKGGDLTALDEHERYLVSVKGLSFDQIRWRRYKLQDYLGRTRGYEFFQQEYPESPDQAFMPVGDSVWSSEQVEIARRTVREPIKITKNGSVKFWRKRESLRQYHIAVDQSAGEQTDSSNRPSDYQAVTVWETTTLDQVASIHGRIPQQELAVMIGELARYYNGALVAPERNQAQYGFIDLLLQQNCNVYVHTDGRYGWPNNVGTKPIALDNYTAVLEAGSCYIRSENLVREMTNFRYLKQRGTRSTGAAPGAHDDELMTAVIAFLPEVREQSFNTFAAPRELVTRRSSVKVFS